MRLVVVFVITIASLAAPGCRWVGFLYLARDPYARVLFYSDQQQVLYLVFHQNITIHLRCLRLICLALVHFCGLDIQVPSLPACLSVTLYTYTARVGNPFFNYNGAFHQTRVLTQERLQYYVTVGAKKVRIFTYSVP